MKLNSEFFKENYRFILAVLANIVALATAIWWAVDSNWKSSNNLELEPIVTSIGLTATLLGLNFVNDKLTKPRLKVKLDVAIAKDFQDKFIYAISATIENHSIFKVFIKNFKVQLPKRDKVIQFLNDGLTGESLSDVILEPGQSFSLHITKKLLIDAPTDPLEYGEFIVSTEIGHKFSVPSKDFQKCLTAIINAESLDKRK